MPPKNAKTSPCEEDAVVTMSALSQLMEQQREIYKDMLLQQQDNFKCFIQLIMDVTNKRLDGVIRDVQELKTSLEFTQAKFEENKMGCTEIEAKIKAFETTITTSKQELDAMFTKLDYIANRSRRTNILIDGIADEKGENWSESEKKRSCLVLPAWANRGDRVDRVCRPDVFSKCRLCFLFWELYDASKIPPIKRRPFTETLGPLFCGLTLPVQIRSVCARGAGPHREQVDFNSEPPWDPS
ncbi:hypothetical protein GJAV_G00099540 [Gymnothorax javanicus]|nr:hypothetical protein GJAV_G00099540 [Gymnothorax javanicus]